MFVDQREKLAQESDSSKKKTIADISDDDSDSDGSSEEDSSRMLSYCTPMLSQARSISFDAVIFFDVSHEHTHTYIPTYINI